jgi:peptide/nickel transport system ATP-binding protein
MTSLNPVLTIGKQITEVMVLHRGCSESEARNRAIDMLKLVNIPEPESRIDQYPHQLSGGMRQRVMIAMALACDPQVLIADEPTTALDVTIQAQILNLMRELRDRTQAAIILITHDLGVVAEMAQRVVVMYAGKKVEEASVNDLFAQPLHPYTKGLLNSMPKLYEGEAKRLEEIPGMVPSLKEEIVGCAFAPRCTYATDQCRREPPQLEEKQNSHWSACWNTSQLLKDPVHG